MRDDRSNPRAHSGGPRGLALAALLIAGCGEAVPHGTPSIQMMEYTCYECGLRRTLNWDMGGRVAEEILECDRHLWWRARIGRAHAHQWFSTHQTTNGGSFCTKDSWVDHSPATGLFLMERLQALGLDLAYHEEFTSPDPRRRVAIIEAAYDFRREWTDDEVRAWWASAFLRVREASD